MHVLENKPFQAEWDSTNSHFKSPTPPAPTTTEKVIRVAWNVLSLIIFPIGLARLTIYGLGRLANIVIFPAPHTPAKEVALYKQYFKNFWGEPFTFNNQEAKENFTAETHTVITPDNAKLDVRLLKHNKADPSTPTVIYFNGNAELMEGTSIPWYTDELTISINPWFIQESINRKTPCNFVFFNYRGVGDSTGTFTAIKDLIVDGSSIVQWVRNDVLKAPPEKIHFYGHSLGGAIAAQTQALDETLTGNHLNSRSFSSLDAIIKDLFGGPLSKFFGWICNKEGYRVDAAEAFNKLKGEKLVVYHPNDRVIPYNVSLQKAVQHTNYLKLDLKTVITVGEESHSLEIPYLEKNLHGAPVEFFKGASEAMGAFLLFASPKDSIGQVV